MYKYQSMQFPLPKDSPVPCRILCVRLEESDRVSKINQDSLIDDVCMSTSNYLGDRVIGQTENATHRAAFASRKRSFSVNGLSITFMILASFFCC